MPLYVVQQNPESTSLEDIARLQQGSENDHCCLVGGYWTPDDGRLLSVFEGAHESVSPVAPGDASVLPVLPITREEYGPPDMESAAAGQPDLSLVLVRRKLDPLTEREFRAVALQAIMCAYEYTDMRWLRSYWARDTDQLFCLFETSCHERVRDHARRSRIPCDEIHDAIEVGAVARAGE